MPWTFDAKFEPYLISGGLLLTYVVAALASYFVMVRIVRPRLVASKSPLLPVLVPMRSLLIWGLLLTGLSEGVQNLPYFQAHSSLSEFIDKAEMIAWILLATVTTIKISNGAFQAQELRLRDQGVDDRGLRDLRERTTLIRKAISGVVTTIGIIYLLRAAGVDTSPLLAGGAVGGIIIGLALQDSLSNVFAGIFLNLERPAKVGDLVRLENDREGFIEDIGWRYTKVRLWSEALLIIPNSKFASSWLINFTQPVNSIMVSVDVNVSLDSDLDRVEEVAIAAATVVQSEFSKPDIAFQPYVRWRQFSDNGVLLRVFMQASDAETQYRMTSQCIKEIHERFRAERIEIPVPIRKIISEGPVQVG